MKIRPTPLLASFALIFSSAFAQTDKQNERIGAAALLALGRTASAPEIAVWTKLGQLPVADLLTQLQQQLQTDPALKRATVIKAGTDAFGRPPTEAEITQWSDGNLNYTGLMQQHLQWLAVHPADYAQVIERAYQFFMRRPAYSIEIEYWNARPTVSYVLLIGAIEDWARRNAPGLMATTGNATVSSNSRYLTTLRLSSAVATEARAATGLKPEGDAETAYANGRNLVAPGGGNIVTSGGIHLVAVGGARLDTAAVSAKP